MFVHMFIFHWKQGVTEDQKARVVPAIRALQGKVPGLLETQVGVNQSPKQSQYMLGGVMKFADKAAMEAYTHHPAHLALLEWLVPLIDPIEVDFET
jgi:hypothetical protein